MNSNYISLKPLTKTERFKFATWDIEAANWWELQLIGMYDGTTYQHFRNLDDFLNYVLQRKYRHYRFFAHFGGKYDLNFVFDHIRNKPEYRLYFFFSGSMAIKMTLHYKDIVVYFCDSYRLLNRPLRELCEAFQVKHQKQKIDFLNIHYSRELIDYNRNDCIGLYEVLASFYEQTGIQSETFATHSLRVWRKDFLSREIFQQKPDVDEFTRSSYVGGRVEVYKRGDTTVNAYDVNSMYPHAMRGKIPVDYSHGGKKLQQGDDLYGFINAIVHIPDNIYIPPLPTRIEKLYFPKGTIHGYWTNEELIYAESLGVKIQRILQAMYFKTDDIFSEYVNKLFTLKKTALEPTRTIAKYLLNSLYGKFGQNPLKQVYCRVADTPDDSYLILDSEGKPTGFGWYETRSRAAYLLPHISAAICSNARIYLHKQLDENSYYCDTDSVFTSRELETSKELGGWSKIGSGIATFIQPKLYKFEGHWKGKGISVKNDGSLTKEEHQRLFDEEVEKFVAGNEHKAQRNRSIKEVLGRPDTPACSTINVTKKLREYRPKRRWVDTNTVPWDYSELVE
jgi:hypothetical protein